MQPLNLPFSENADEFVTLISKHNITRRKKYDTGNLNYDEQIIYTYNAEQYPLTANGGQIEFKYN